MFWERNENDSTGNHSPKSTRALVPELSGVFFLAIPPSFSCSWPGCHTSLTSALVFHTDLCERVVTNVGLQC